MRKQVESIVGWGRVEERVEKAVIVASGPSARVIDWRSFHVPNDVALVSVNGTLPHLPKATHWFTVDPSVRNRQIMWECRTRLSVRFYAGAPLEGYTRREPWVTYLKKKTGAGTRGACFGLSEDPEWVSTGNSAYGALGLLYLMGVKKVALIGVDATVRYWHGTGTPFGNLDIMQELFASAVPQLQKADVEVLNGSPNSKVDCFPRTTPYEAIEWISE